MKIASWNTRGLNKPVKQKSVGTFLEAHHIDIFGILKSKLNQYSLDNMMRIRFHGMKALHDFDFSSKGRILIIWNPSYVITNVLDIGE